ncbi:MAG: ImmA/IrrE family metallo-endopeptidase [Thermodesulfobacteriota bacterium]
MGSAKRNEFTPNVIFPPGFTLAETIAFLGMSQAELAARIGRTPKFVNELIAGKAPLHEQTAMALERVLDVPASLWTGLESQYRLHKARTAESLELETMTPWVRLFPMREMIKRGWIRKCFNQEATAKELLRFFGVASPDAWDEIWGREQYSVAFRRSQKYAPNVHAMAAWLRQGELEAARLACAAYDPGKFRETIPAIRALTRMSEPAQFLPRLTELCCSCGVAVVFLPEVAGTHVSGAARWVGKRPIIQLSLRHKTDDHLWFAFFHEAKHILDHPRQKVFINGFDGDSPEEQEANAFAAETLIPAKELKIFIAGRTRLADIRDFAARTGISAGIVVGRLQHEKVIPYNVGNQLKVRYRWILPGDDESQGQGGKG